MHKTLIISAIFQFGAVSFAGDGAQGSQPGNYNCAVMCQGCGDSPTCAVTMLVEQDREVHICPPSKACSEPASLFLTEDFSRNLKQIVSGSILGSVMLGTAVVLPLFILSKVLNFM
ncbi:MAG: hypothetical protein HYW48_12575 [Deltaproteobacteria bacterium]|nr:hypothetical protein [Deltaproteobacteria bacterium]